MLLTDRLTKTIARYMKVSVLCLALGFGAGYYTAYKSTGIEERLQEISYDTKEKRFYIPKESIPLKEDASKRHQSIEDLFRN